MLEIITTIASAIAVRATNLGVEILGENVKEANALAKKKRTNSQSKKTLFELDDLHSSIVDHLREIEGWATHLSFAELRGKRKTVKKASSRT